MALLKQSTAYARVFVLVDSTDHVSAKTGLTPSVNLSKAGATFAAAGGTVSEIGSGAYKVALTTTDTGTLGDLAFDVIATGADRTQFIDQVVAFDPSDGAALGLGRLDAAVSSRLAAGNVTVGSYAAGQDPATLTLATPANKLATDGSGRITVGSNADKTGYALSAGEHTAIGNDVLGAALSEPGARPAWATMTVARALQWLSALALNKLTQTSATQTLRNDADTSSTASAAVSDDGTTFTRGKWS